MGLYNHKELFVLQMLQENCVVPTKKPPTLSQQTPEQIPKNPSAHTTKASQNLPKKPPKCTK